MVIWRDVFLTFQSIALHNVRKFGVNQSTAGRSDAVAILHDDNATLPFRHRNAFEDYEVTAPSLEFAHRYQSLGSTRHYPSTPLSVNRNPIEIMFVDDSASLAARDPSEEGQESRVLLGCGYRIGILEQVKSNRDARYLAIA